MFQQDIAIDVEGADEPRWVSRGAYKLIKGLEEWGIDPSGWSCVDIGASTGGFTQVLLSRGALRVAAVDVGYGQLAWQLRNNPRVALFERTNARYVTSDDIGWAADMLTVDASFISLRLLLPNLQWLIKDNGIIIALVKPQFEVGRQKVGRGVVLDPALHLEVLDTLADFIRKETALALSGATYSPIRGPEGNIEFIFFMIKRVDLVASSHTQPGDSFFCEESALRAKAMETGLQAGFWAGAQGSDFAVIVREAHESGRTNG
ncbi:MAG: TlyA family RNA methyltransferase [Synergistaceae bacterium]|jgi:23S rRNA (cytidine1920-2'-O)/16S rRNA (cytidine1409-2'-O)-methyltransferase|nr:TlyA family RNA methyltransferase [Synergistaceae bacterium]